MGNFVKIGKLWENAFLKIVPANWSTRINLSQQMAESMCLERKSISDIHLAL